MAIFISKECDHICYSQHNFRTSDSSVLVMCDRLLMSVTGVDRTANSTESS